MNRHDFILKTGAAAASGVIPVRFYKNCVDWLNNHDQPLIVPVFCQHSNGRRAQEGHDFQRNIGLVRDVDDGLDVGRVRACSTRRLNAQLLVTDELG